MKAAGPLAVRGDRDLLIEAVTNLVDDAIKFTPEGGRVTIDCCVVKAKPSCV